MQGKGLFEQLESSNIHHYEDMSSKTIVIISDHLEIDIRTIFGKGMFDEDVEETIKKLTCTDDEENLILAREIIQTLYPGYNAIIQTKFEISYQNIFITDPSRTANLIPHTI